MSPSMPRFDVSEYVDLLRALRAALYSLSPVSQIRAEPTGRRAYVSHDLDISLGPAAMMAEAEARLGVTSTYYVLLTGHYNVLSPSSIGILKGLVELGHEIGLHYDLQTYPREYRAAWDRLRREVDLLASATGRPVETISMHQPHVGHSNTFLRGDEFINRHDPRFAEGLLYVSDSCRAWRDTSLLSCFGPRPPRRLLLLTHPELWLDGSIDDRYAYLEDTLEPAATADMRRYLTNDVKEVWRSHPAARMHDAREGS